MFAYNAGLGNWIKSLFMLLVPFVVFVVCRSLSVDEKTTFYIVVTSGAIYCWMFNVMTAAIVAIIVPILYLLLDVADIKVVFSPWASPMPWLCFGGMLIGQMMSKSGLATRIAYKCMLFSGNSLLNILIGFMIAGFLIAPLVPTALGKMAIFLILASSICRVLDLHSDSKESAIIFLTSFFAVAGPAYGFLTGCVQVPAAVGLMVSASGIEVSWLDYAYHNFIIAVFYSVLCFLAVFIVLHSSRVDGIGEVVRDRYSALGKMSFDEKKSVAILLFALLLLMTESFHKINSAWCMMGVAFLCFTPAVGLLDSEDLDKINFSMLYFIAGAISIGAVASDIGLATKIADFCASFLTGVSAAVYIIASFFLGVCSVMFLSPVTGVTTLGVPLTELALKVGVDPRPMVYSLFFGMDMYFLPYQYGLLLFLASCKCVRFKFMLSVLVVKFLLSIIFLLPFMLVYWHLIGLW